MSIKLSTICLFLLTSLFLSGCTAKKTSPVTETLVKDQIMVLLAKRAVPTPIVEGLKAYEARAKGPSSRTENRWVIVYNMKLIQPEEMLQKIKSFDTVLEAEFLPLKTDI